MAVMKNVKLPSVILEGTPLPPSLLTEISDIQKKEDLGRSVFIPWSTGHFLLPGSIQSNCVSGEW